jgi:glycosyltransferase involved in cell wall biosynthesis
MKILTIASGGGLSNGALLAAINNAHGLAERGDAVSMLVPPGSFVDRNIDRSRVEVLHSSLNRWPFTELNRVRRWIEEQEIDVVHTHCSRASAFGVLLRRLYGVPVVATAHANKLQLHWCFNDHVVAVSDATRRFHISHNLVPPWKITTILNPIDTKRFKPASEETRLAVRVSHDLPEDSLLLCIVGNVIPRKGHADAVQALAKIVDLVPHARLVIMGRGGEQDTKAVKQVAEKFGVSDKLCWLGYREDAASLLAAMDIVLCPSIDEPFGLVAPESLACEIPVIATAVGGFQTTIQDGETGYLVKPRCPEELAAATLQLIRNPSLRRNFGQQGRKWVMEHLSPDAHFSQLRSVLQRVADNATSYRRRIKSNLKVA